MSSFVLKLYRYGVIGCAVFGALSLGLWVMRTALSSNKFGSTQSVAVSPNGHLKAYITRDSGFGAMTPDIVGVVIAELGQPVSSGTKVLHGSNLSGINLKWLNDSRLQISLPCARFRSQNYYNNKDYSKGAEVVVVTPDPHCWNRDGE